MVEAENEFFYIDSTNIYPQCKRRSYKKMLAIPVETAYFTPCKWLRQTPRLWSIFVVSCQLQPDAGYSWISCGGQ